MLIRVLHRLPLLLAGSCLLMLSLAAAGAAHALPAAASSQAGAFVRLFAGIVLDAFPFLLLGVILSAAVEEFVPEAAIRRLIPRHPAGGILFGSVLGLLLPLCECGLIPLVRRMIHKGMPVYTGMVYIAAGPILNPVTIISTWTAFRDRQDIVFCRLGLAFVISAALGILLYRSAGGNALRSSSAGYVHGGGQYQYQHDRHDHDHLHRHDHDHARNDRQQGTIHRGSRSGAWGSRARSRLAAVFSHAVQEFADTGKYVLFGACLAAIIQTILPPGMLSGASAHPLQSHLFAMGFAYMLSLCSTTDAFVAATFAGTVGPGPLIAFLVFGPMVDLKNTMVMLSVFRPSVVLRFSLIVAVLALAGSLAAGALVAGR